MKLVSFVLRILVFWTRILSRIILSILSRLSAFKALEREPVPTPKVKTLLCSRLRCSEDWPSTASMPTEQAATRVIVKISSQAREVSAAMRRVLETLRTEASVDGEDVVLPEDLGFISLGGWVEGLGVHLGVECGVDYAAHRAS